MSNSGWTRGCMWPSCVTTLLWKCLACDPGAALLSMCAPQHTPPKMHPDRMATQSLWGWALGP